MHKRKVAVFDFDGTITKRDTFSYLFAFLWVGKDYPFSI